MRSAVCRRLAVLAATVIGVTAAPPAPAHARPEPGSGPTPAVTYRESFERDLGGWQPDTDGRARAWRIVRTPGPAVDGRYSLSYYLDGTWDDGTIWIERTIPVRPSATVTVKVSFWLHSPSASYTAWPVVGVAGARDPETERDLPVLGVADQRAGWAPYSFQARVTSGADGTLWVAVGISATFEVVRTYHLDLVEVAVDAP
jgi:hypothetical protein